MPVSPNELSQLRQQIDDIDNQLVELLAKRAKVTARVGKYKSKVGLPIYVPEREAELIAKRRKEAEQLNVSPVLVEDLLRRIMRESYHTQNVDYLCTNPNIQKIVVIGGAGALGRVFVDMFKRSGYPVQLLEKDDWENADSILRDAGLVLVAVPIKLTESVISKLTNLPQDCVLVDITSTKQKPLAAMMAAHKGPVLGLHPMFGPDVASMVKQVVVVCHGRDGEQYEWLLQQIRIWGGILQQTTAKEHDDAMVFIQVMRHFCSFVFGSHLSGENPDLQQLISLSSPIYRLELAMVGRLFAQDPVLYADIIFDNKDSVAILTEFSAKFNQALALVESNNKGEFVKQFLNIGSWFGDYAKQCLVDSRKLLLKADDDRSLSEDC
ncbi:bifunctional chorismate mutase/prephenate dehydrogenase [Paraglaciecola arctica]|uniref:bifunctional chorismate mutase/prephenate dehydrogenase n=1 Tax=Paraglaciecola arctica TaxID=1128911 RepID=UPI001C06BCC1|nr:bifunctional chorismate mutase/prephenate dehydrogenase [Paraglaciecola arctica]MBU3002992.1 bifunctional chorismate mutase/prephenate dehydrogenase [Paraglaciecola arctica]